MSSIDERIVTMRFDNAQFERGVKTTLASIEALNSKLQLKGATKGLADVSAATKNLSLAHIASGVENISSKFTSLGIIGVTALTNIANRAVNAGATMLKSLTVDPVKSGLAEYETNLNSIQTILANTGLEGKAGLQEVTGALAELNKYSDQTIYNFSEMARNIGTFTAAGVKLDVATGAIKGIANLAAVSGSSAEQASTAMYQLSQAISTGTVKLMDWNSVVNAGMGGKVFQEALKDTARNHGVAVDQIIKKEGSFRDSLQTGWLSSKILTETLNKFTGDMTDAQLKQMGYTDKQIEGIQKMAKTAKDAATKVKTMSQLIGTLQEAAGSGWAKTWELIFGDFDEARELFTNVNNALGGIISSSADARNKVLGDWKKLGGRTVLIEGIANVFHALGDVIGTIKDTFREFFPPATGRDLYNLTVAFRDFTEKLKMGEGTLDKIARTFAGVFAVLDIGRMIIVEAAKMLAKLFGVATEGDSSFLDITARIGDFLVSVQNAIRDGKGLTKFFEGLGKVLAIPIRIIKKLIDLLGDLFGGLEGVDLGGFDAINEKLSPLERIGQLISKVWDGVTGSIKAAWNAFLPLADKMSGFFTTIGDAISESFSNVDYSTILDTINTGLFAGLVLLIRKFLKGGVNVDVGGGFLSSITEAFGGLTGTMQAMQQQLKANTLLKIAGAIALLTVSVVALSMIDSAKLAKALTAITVMFVQLGAAMVAFDKVTSIVGAAKMPLIAAGLILLAIAIDILAIAVAKLAQLSWEDLAKGLTGVTVLIAALVAATRGIDKNAKGMIRTGASLILLALAIKLLADSVEELSGLSWEEMAKGLVGVGALLASLAIFTRLAGANKGGLAQGAGIILLAVGIKILASALKDFGEMSWEEIGKGLAAMAGGLTLIAAALILIPPTSILSAAAVLVVAASLGMIGDAIKKMGSMKWGTIGKGLTALAGALTAISLALALLPPTSLLSAAAIFIVASSLGMIADALGTMGGKSWSEIGKGLVTLAGSLAIIAAAMYLMTGALPGAAALFIVAASLKMLAPVLTTFGEMSWEEIGKGLLMLAGVFVVLGVAGLVLGPVVPVLIGLGIAIALLGVGAIAAGAGLLLMALGLTALAAAGGAAVAVVVGIVAGLIGLIPELMTQLGLGIIAFAKVIGTAGPAFVKAITVVLLALLEAISRVAPKIVTTFFKIIVLLLAVLSKAVPMMVNSGMQLITGVLNGIAKNIGKVVTAATNVVTKFLDALGKNLPKIIDAGVKFIINFVNGCADAIRDNSDEMGEAGGNLGTAIVEGMVRGIGGGISAVTSAARNLASSALNAAKNALGIHSPSKEFEKLGKFSGQGFAKGLTGSREEIKAAYTAMRDLLKDAMQSSKEDIEQQEEKLKKLTDARHKDTKAIKEAEKALAQARKEHKATTAAYKELTQHLDDEKDRLKKFASQLDVVNRKLDAAEQKLADAKRTRDDYKKSITDQFDNLPDISEGTSLLDFTTDLRADIKETQKFATVLQKLRKMGLSDQLYKELLARGAAALPFAQELLDSGKAGVTEVNKLAKQLEDAAKKLGKTASKELYQAAVDSAQGLVDGLKKQQKHIEAIMEEIAEKMVKAIKKKLGIKSPSKEFYEIGENSGEGLSNALLDYSDTVEKSAEKLGTDAILALRKSISGMSDLINGDIDVTPTITPVLDLTGVKKTAGQLTGILGATPLKVGASYSGAKDVSTGYWNNRNAMDDPGTQKAAVQQNVNFTQINQSPKALSEAEIYRNTKNQLSVAKGALK